MIVPLSAVQALGHALFLALGARVRTVASGARRVRLYEKKGSGQGPPLLLVHGLGGNANSYAALVRGAARISRRVIVPDLPGHGRSALQRGDLPLKLPELADALLAVVDDAGEPAVIVGNSLGGALGLHALLERPARVLGWVGLAPAGAPLTAHDRQDLRRTFGGGLPAARELTRKLWHKPPLVSWLVLRDFARYWKLPEIEPMVADVLSSEVSLGLSRLRNAGRPALVLWGESDTLLPRSSVDWFRQQLGEAAVELLPRCGHLPQLERPRLVARRLEQFMKELS